MANKKNSMIYHPIKLRSGVIIYLPTSVPMDLHKYVDMSNLVQDKELENFKRRVSKGT